MLASTFLVGGKVVGQVVIQESFTGLTGDNTTTAGSASTWSGNSNFTVTSAYQAGGAVKLGTSSATGSLTSTALNLSSNSGCFNVSFKVKGWSTVEGNILVYLKN